MARTQEYMTIDELKEKLGCPSGRYKKVGYVLVRMNGKYIPEHRLIWLQHSELIEIPKGKIIHHINGVKDDNRIENLQIMTQKQHMKLHHKQNK